MKLEGKSEMVKSKLIIDLFTRGEQCCTIILYRVQSFIHSLCLIFTITTRKLIISKSEDISITYYDFSKNLIVL